MHKVIKAALTLTIAGVAYAAVPRQIRIQLPGPRYLLPTKPVQTVSLQQAMAEPRAGYVTVTFLYLSNLPGNVAIELVDDVKVWKQKGVAVRAYSIDPVPWKSGIARYAKNIGLDVQPSWIEMPDGAACAFNQMEAVKYFTNRDIDPQVNIPMLTLALTDRDGKTITTYAVTVPNGEAFDPSDLDGALLPFSNAVTRAARAPATPF